MSASVPAIRSLTWATDIDVLALDARVERRDGHWVIRSPGNPAYWFGNFLLFDGEPETGCHGRWERLFSQALPDARHRLFAWDRADGELGCAEAEFLDRGYALERVVGLIATPDQLVAHPRENREVAVRALSAEPGVDRAAWAQVFDLWLADRRDDLDETDYRAYSHVRLAELQAMFRAGRGAWWVAELDGGEVVGSLGIVVTGGRARFQAVDTAAAYRGRGICSRLTVEAARRTAELRPIDHFVICADPGYHALGLYESLGFVRAEEVAAVLLTPPGSSS